MKPVIVNLFEGEKDYNSVRFIIYKSKLVVEFSGTAKKWCSEYVIPCKYYPAIIEALKKVSEGE
ncbi:hypothetical protein C4561_01415 [candidate division WWE3 bacterium]|uniref:Uncharacterized protein n=1 Tax=candidate division WWE3 bacterium TaxID=2053526 RepID=A0A3A4ZF27_UNCKA|nr:MAG: hypothetical protein C4561_01415 [candidate division WWE3 bacterium]